MNPAPIAIIVAALLVLPACGNGDPSEEAATPTPVVTAASPEPTESEQSRPAGQRKTKTRTYRVQRGDSLSVIAARFDTTVRELVRLNDIEDKHHIRVGQELKIPAAN